MRGSLNENTKDFFWVVDSTTGRYRTIALTGTPGDANRIHSLLGEKLPSGRQITLDKVRQNLAELESRKQARRADFYRRADARRLQAALNRPPSGIPGLRLASLRGLSAARQPGDEIPPSAAAFNALAAQPFPRCYGGGEAAIAHMDAIFQRLVETYTWADWWFDGYGSYQAYAGGSCWANPNTGVSTWHVGACRGELSTSLSHALADTDNYSFNWDFGDPDLITNVVDSAEVFHAGGFPDWATFHDDWGEFHEIIFGWTLFGYSRC